MRKKIKKNKKSIIAVCLLVAALFVVFKPKYNQANAMKASANVAEVNVVAVKKQKIQLTQELPGRVEALRISEVRPQVDGIIRKIKFIEGSFVKEGQQLYQIDPTVYKIAQQTADANLKALKAKKERYQNLVELDAVSKQEYDDAVASYESAKASSAAARNNLEYSKVLAPISGYIGKTNITEGRLVTTNQADVLTTITQLDPVYVDMAQPTRDMIKLGNQKEIKVTVLTEDPTYKNSGTLKFSEVFADESTDSVRLRATFSNKDGKLIPGMFVTGKLHLKPIEAVIVPQKATMRTPDGNLLVFVVKEGIAKARSIKAEQTYNDNWVVIEGLEDGEVVILEGYQKIADGAKVNPVEVVVPSIEEKK
ncbi:MAG: efflux RND transporter periplasmic adaptor subunit [Pseudomonadota bacterium]